MICPNPNFPARRETRPIALPATLRLQRESRSRPCGSDGRDCRFGLRWYGWRERQEQSSWALTDLSSEHAQGTIRLAILFPGPVLRIDRDSVAFPRCKKQVLVDSMLPGVQVVIAAAGSVEFGVRPALYNAPLFHHENLVCATDGGKPVSNDKGRPALHQVGKTVLNQLLPFRVEAGGR